jgi:hypothetical protein
MEGEISGQDEITVGENGSITSDELRAPSVVIAGTVKVKTIASPNSSTRSLSARCAMISRQPVRLSGAGQRFGRDGGDHGDMSRVLPSRDVATATGE